MKIRWAYSRPCLTVAFLALLPSAMVGAATFTITPPAGCTDGDEFTDRANSLEPGDVLILRGGTYCDTDRRNITVRGTANAPITIRAADGEVPILTRLDDPTGPQNYNGIEVFGEHLIIRGLHFERGDAGVRFNGGSHHVTFEDNEVSNTSNNAVTLNSGDTDSFVIRRNHLHDTGLFNGSTEGEGLYVGCHEGNCTASNHVIEGNYIHHLRGTSGGGNDGIEIKTNSFGNVVRDNVIHDTTIGTSYPCIFAYGNQTNGRPPNIIEGNVVWNCGEAILVTSDAIVRNNIVLDSDIGIHARLQNPMNVVRNVSITNNTVVGHEGAALRVVWSAATNMVLANNAIYNVGGVAVDASGLSRASITVSSNYVSGSGATVDNDRFFAGGSTSAAFRNAGANDLWLSQGSPLRNNADPEFAPPLDFNGASRTGPYDVGAYETDGAASNPGWTIVEGFKPLSDAPQAPRLPAPQNFQVQ